MLFPAYAGVILYGKDSKKYYEAFPRIRGGDPRFFICPAIDRPLFPAYAGVIPEIWNSCLRSAAFPRIRGGDPQFAVNGADINSFSPHTRG